MAQIRYTTAGESHGKQLVGIIENIPSGLYIDEQSVNNELSRRMTGYGRGGRMKIERDSAEFVTGVRAHYSIASPITVIIQNRDYENWKNVMGADATDSESKKVTAVRPGHADLSGAVKYGFSDARNVLERASARETAMKVALGAVAKLYLSALGIKVMSRTVEIGGIAGYGGGFDVDNNPVRCGDDAATKAMIELIDKAKASGDTLGGVSEIKISGCKSSVGSYISSHQKLDGLIMREVGAVQSVKAVEIGDGIFASRHFGSEVHDAIYAENGRIYRKTNRAGGIEGGMSNGEDIIVRAYFKPIPTLARGLDTVDLINKTPVKAASERSDVCAVPAGGVVCEAACALALASALSDMLGGDTMDQVIKRYADL